MRKSLPQFKSAKEAVDYFEQYGELTFYGKSGQNYEYSLFDYKVRDGRLLKINIYDNGKVVYRE